MRTETRHYGDGTSATGPGPLPDLSPEQQTNSDRPDTPTTKIKAMTVAQLRDALVGMPDDAPVLVESYVPFGGDEFKRGGLLVHVDGQQSEIDGISVCLWSAEALQ